MPPKGGGRKAFLKGKKALVDSDEEAETPAKQPAKKVPAAAKPDKSAAFKLDSASVQAADPAPAPAQTGANAGGGAEAAAPDETRGQMLQRHKRDLKNLKEQQKRLGKKGKDEADRLEEQLESKHAAEVAAMDAREGKGRGGAAEAVEVADSLYSVKLTDEPEKTKKPTKAQRQREKKVAREAEREARIAEELANMPETERHAEAKAMRALLRPLQLQVHEIQPDGHCLYRSVEHQLSLGAQGGYSLDVKGLRQAAADYMWAHKAHFMPFLEFAEQVSGDESEGEDEDDEGGSQQDQELDKKRAESRFKAYCKKVESTAAWGGHLELQALSAGLKRKLVVYAVGAPPLELGEEFAGKGEPLRVCFLRHSYALGEHYNSVLPGVIPDSEDEHEEPAAAQGQTQQQQGAGEEEDYVVVSPVSQQAS